MTNSGMFEDPEKIEYLENQNKLLKQKLKEEYANENAAIEGKEPTTQDADIQELKIENVKYKLKEVLPSE